MIPNNFFGLTVQSYNYNWAPLESWPAIPFGVARSWDVWSPGNGQITGLAWNTLNPASGVFNWVPLDAWIAANQAHNMPMVYTFGATPSWAGDATQPDPVAFQVFVTAIVAHAGTAIKFWEGWNEIDTSSGLAPTLATQFQQIIYDAVHPTGSQVLSATVSSAGADGIYAQFLAAGAGAWFDIAAYHGYNNATGEGVIAPTVGIQAALAKAGITGKPIWCTEWGMWPGISGTTNQEAFVTTGLILLAAMGVTTEIFYAYDNAASELAARGSSSFALTPAGIAFNTVTKWLSGATVGAYAVAGSIYTVPIAIGSQSNLLVWNSGGQSDYATKYGKYQTTQGQTADVKHDKVTISAVPILLTN